MKLLNFLGGAGVALLIAALAAPAWGQAVEPNGPNGSTAVAPAATAPTVPGERAAPGAPGSGMSADNPAAAAAPSAFQSDMTNADYVHRGPSY